MDGLILIILVSAFQQITHALLTSLKVSFAGYHDPRFESFGSLRVLNEDRVAPQTGFPTHPHRDAEIFSYIINGELTHRDSMVTKGSESNGVGKNAFYRMKRDDLQFTTGGKGIYSRSFLITHHVDLLNDSPNESEYLGIAHSEQNESQDWVHFLQIWAIPWTRSLTPRYHTSTFPSTDKRIAFVPLISPLAAGPNATDAEEAAAVPAVEGTIPIHADLMMGAGIIPVGKRFKWSVRGEGGKTVRKGDRRRVYLHVPMAKGGSAKVRVDGREEAVLGEGDGCFIEGLKGGDLLGVESVGEGEAEVVVLDSD